MIQGIPKIEDSFEKMEVYPQVTERYYQPFYYVHESGSPNEHHCVLLHSNKICLITLAASHPIVEDNKNIVKLDFQVTHKIDRLDNRVMGKGKRGAQPILPDSVLCYVDCDDGSRYSIWGCIRGKLLEINQLLLNDPNLMVKEPSSKGFIAIILPSLKDLSAQKKNLLTHEKYMTIKNRQL